MVKGGRLTYPIIPIILKKDMELDIHIPQNLNNIYYNSKYIFI